MPVPGDRLGSGVGPVGEQPFADVPVPAAPLDEAAGAAADRGSGGHPFVQVALSAEPRFGAVFPRPGRQGDCGADAGSALPDRAPLDVAPETDDAEALRLKPRSFD
ncbi:hypothetical protein GCM10010517_34210 [Streptosporangium fragile]|uniref:Uncharacterized protein n=1 Tax=Streptosporangium fragile TaxID=46186 RepID=A0ABN3VXP1_9ACTN